MKSVEHIMGANNKTIEWQYDFIFSPSFSGFLSLIPEGVIISDEDGRVLLTNRIAQQLFGYSEQEFLQVVIEDLVPAHIKPVHAKMRKLFFNDPTPRFLDSRDLNLHAVRKDGSLFPMESALFAISTDRGMLAVNLLRDISKQKAYEGKISEYAFIDALTNLPNRRYFDSTMNSLIKKAERSGKAVAVMYIDLDHFKSINDEHGHAVGDWVLQETVSRLLSVLREEDFLARVGGDEFVLVLYPAGNKENLYALAERIVTACNGPFHHEAAVYHTSVSVGIAVAQGAAIDVEALLAEADAHMYTVKQQGGGAYHGDL